MGGELNKQDFDRYCREQKAKEELKERKRIENFEALVFKLIEKLSKKGLIKLAPKGLRDWYFIKTEEKAASIWYQKNMAKFFNNES